MTWAPTFSRAACLASFLVSLAARTRTVPSTKRFSTRASVTASTGGASIRIRSYTSRASSINASNAWEAKSSAGLGGQHASGENMQTRHFFYPSNSLLQGLLIGKTLESPGDWGISKGYAPGPAGDRTPAAAPSYPPGRSRWLHWRWRWFSPSSAEALVNKITLLPLSIFRYFKLVRNIL